MGGDFGGSGPAPVVDDRLTWNFAPTSNGALDMLGWYEQTAAAAALASGSPVNAGAPGYSSHYSVDVSAAVGAPFTMRFTGDTIDESTGAISAADTEDVAIAGNGFIQTLKTFIDEPSISIVEGAKSCTIDVFRTSYWDHKNKDYTLTGLRFEFTPDSPTWTVTPRIRKVNNDGSISVVDSFTFAQSDTPPRAANGSVGKHKRGDYAETVLGSQQEGIVVDVTQTNMGKFFMGLEFRD